MIGTDSLNRVIGNTVYDNDGDKIGTASEVFLDDQTGNPEWVTVKTGLFGSKESFVPIRDADLTDDGLRVPVSKAAVKDAPRIDTEGHLSPEEETQLYRHYSMGSDTTNTMTTGTAGMGTTGRTETTEFSSGRTDTDRMGTGRSDTDLNTHGTKGHDTSGPTTDDAMTLSEERLQVGTQQTEVGRARLRKYVVSENVTQTVPVSREEVRIEREPITDANRGAAYDGPAISEEEHEVTLHAERPVVAKEAVPVERVRLDTQTVTDQETVSETVRKEQVDTDGIQGTGMQQGTTGEKRGFVDKAKDALDRDNDGKVGR
ncbi:DUF2382 domain-containing protein [Modestobacter sp. I12A-02628]|uniref:PRC and DUF2382 domain-containing protein n=1 Tax=Goekera deserti TaxID=2497753 RepID=A0A7K3WJG0_9ACTN|nr:PRC and DUF2382 domain-containing protein [Goekera deserti]MPQ98972.1 DUF2382 domain-containing protein [Goekera deserti]NDI50576.1 DUF2382 domain-containing protein [Goekera deserti]NEL56635.1 PRC and DUF2382 domain-containing protein [Goekera deserti]